MKNKSLILGLIFVAIVAGVIYYGAQKPAEQIGVTEISDWKSYTDSVHGFSFSYPADWTLETRGSESVFEVIIDSVPACQSCRTVFAFYSSADLITGYDSSFKNFAEFIDYIKKLSTRSELYGKEVQEITINGQVFYVQLTYGELSDQNIFWTEKNGEIYEIITSASYKEDSILKSVIPSFKLL